jgi:hypothetical protein
MFRPTRNQQKIIKIRKTPPQQQSDQSFQNYQQTNINTHQKINYQKYFRCGQTSYTQIYCPHHLNE